MAHYDGQTLKQKLEAGPLDIDTALEIAAQVAEGLAKAHAQGVVHRDIKPGNLMVTEEAVKILDFGLAKFASSLQLTIEGSTLGTAAYMSPEQVRGEEADARSDLWALGVVLYEMLAGRVPFHGAYAEAVAYAIRNEPPASLRTQRPEVPEALEQTRVSRAAQGAGGPLPERPRLGSSVADAAGPHDGAGPADRAAAGGASRPDRAARRAAAGERWRRPAAIVVARAGRRRRRRLPAADPSGRARAGCHCTGRQPDWLCRARSISAGADAGARVGADASRRTSASCPTRGCCRSCGGFSLAERTCRAARRFRPSPQTAERASSSFPRSSTKTAPGAAAQKFRMQRPAPTLPCTTPSRSPLRCRRTRRTR